MRSAESTDALLRPTPVLQFRIPHFTFRTRMSHLLALALLGVDCLVRAWRIQLAVWTAGGRLSFTDAFRLNLYGEAASQLTPNRLGGEPARFLGLHEAGLRPVTAIVAIGVEVACEWPVFVLAAGAPRAPPKPPRADTRPTPGSGRRRAGGEGGGLGVPGHFKKKKNGREA